LDEKVAKLAQLNSMLYTECLSYVEL